MDWGQQTVGFVIRPCLHNPESFCVFTATLESAQFVQYFKIFKPVLDTKLLFQKIAMLAFMLPEGFNFLIILFSDIHVVIGWGNS